MSEPQAPSAWLLYRNHRGDTAWRHVIPIDLYFGAMPPWHKEMGWLLGAKDLGKDAYRTFALCDLLAWQNEKPADA